MFPVALKSLEEVETVEKGKLFDVLVEIRFKPF